MRDVNDQCKLIPVILLLGMMCVCVCFPSLGFAGLRLLPAFVDITNFLGLIVFLLVASVGLD